MDLKKNFQSKSAVNIFLKDFVNYVKAGHCIFLSGDLGVGKIRLMGAPVKYNALEGFGLEVVEFVEPGLWPRGSEERKLWRQIQLLRLRVSSVAFLADSRWLLVGGIVLL